MSAFENWKTYLGSVKMLKLQFAKKKNIFAFLFFLL